MQKIIVDFVNVVSTANIQKKIDLGSVAEKLPGAELNPSRFPGIIIKTKDPRATALIFSSGAIICTGTKSISQAYQTTGKIILMLKNAGYDTTQVRVKIENIVVSVNYGKQIDLERCARILPRCMYEPEQFPAVFYRMGTPAATMLLYNTGRLICTGLNTQEKIILAITNLNKSLTEKHLFI